MTSSRAVAVHRASVAVFAVLACSSLSACAHGTATSDAPADPAVLALAHEWVDTWNQRDVERMAALHADPADTRYGLCHDFFVIGQLLADIRASDFFGATWEIAIEDPHVRMLATDGAVASFRLVGVETSGSETRPFEGAFTLVFERVDGDWKIVHVQDSTCPEST